MNKLDLKIEEARRLLQLAKKVDFNTEELEQKIDVFISHISPVIKRSVYGIDKKINKIKHYNCVLSDDCNFISLSYMNKDNIDFKCKVMWDDIDVLINLLKGTQSSFENVDEVIEILSSVDNFDLEATDDVPEYIPQKAEPVVQEEVLQPVELNEHIEEVKQEEPVSTITKAEPEKVEEEIKSNLKERQEEYLAQKKQLEAKKILDKASEIRKSVDELDTMPHAIKSLVEQYNWDGIEEKSCDVNALINVFMEHQMIKAFQLGFKEELIRDIVAIYIYVVGKNRLTSLQSFPALTTEKDKEYKLDRGLIELYFALIFFGLDLIKITSHHVYSSLDEKYVACAELIQACELKGITTISDNPSTLVRTVETTYGSLFSEDFNVRCLDASGTYISLVSPDEWIVKHSYFSSLLNDEGYFARDNRLHEIEKVEPEVKEAMYEIITPKIQNQISEPVLTKLLKLVSEHKGMLVKFPTGTQGELYWINVPDDKDGNHRGIFITGSRALLVSYNDEYRFYKADYYSKEHAYTLATWFEIIKGTRG